MSTTRPTGRSPRTAARVIAYGGVALAIALAWLVARGGARSAPWEIGKNAEVDLTLIAKDQNQLGCAARTEVGGAHCAFIRAGLPAPYAADTAVLRPYTTTGGRRLLGSGLWTQLKPPLPEGRFSVRCTFAVMGKVPNPGIRWRDGDEFVEAPSDWFAGPLLDCKRL